MTYMEAKKMGYTDSYTALQRGYVSRKVDISTQEVHKGRYGLYVLLPNWRSSRYCIRQYLTR